MNTLNWYKNISGKFDEDGNRLKKEPEFVHVGKRPRRKSLKQLDVVDKEFNTFEKWVNTKKELVS